MHLLNNLRDLVEFLGAIVGALAGTAKLMQILLTAVAKLWRTSLLKLAAMAEDLDDYRLKRRASRMRLEVK
jgi:hypothetical protein